MRNNFRAFKASLIMGILLVSVFAIMIPASSVKAQGIFSFASVVDINWVSDNQTNVIVKPNQEYGSYKIKVDYTLTRGLDPCDRYLNILLLVQAEWPHILVIT